MGSRWFEKKEMRVNDTRQDREKPRTERERYGGQGRQGKRGIGSYGFREIYTFMYRFVYSLRCRYVAEAAAGWIPSRGDDRGRDKACLSGGFKNHSDSSGLIKGNNPQPFLHRVCISINNTHLFTQRAQDAPRRRGPPARRGC